eukprot:gnl/Carplike_NY0171/3051_a4098_478.p1 GENE.gnl/Carplike_NY0171/3051_a4098_478~~gnl/Carplike_NY0171/3051_a4098_478.p1  ORF type:complete len:604 (+),score=157.38 gnl/Carplike_NY0171/3051_a4098_478:239-1813(+)
MVKLRNLAEKADAIEKLLIDGDKECDIAQHVDPISEEKLFFSYPSKHAIPLLRVVIDTCLIGTSLILNYLDTFSHHFPLSCIESAIPAVSSEGDDTISVSEHIKQLYLTNPRLFISSLLELSSYCCDIDSDGWIMSLMQLCGICEETIDGSKKFNHHLNHTTLHKVYLLVRYPPIYCTMLSQGSEQGEMGEIETEICGPKHSTAAIRSSSPLSPSLQTFLTNYALRTTALAIIRSSLNHLATSGQLLSGALGQVIPMDITSQAPGFYGDFIAGVGEDIAESRKTTGVKLSQMSEKQQGIIQNGSLLKDDEVWWFVHSPYTQFRVLDDLCESRKVKRVMFEIFDDDESELPHFDDGQLVSQLLPGLNVSYIAKDQDVSAFELLEDNDAVRFGVASLHHGEEKREGENGSGDETTFSTSLGMDGIIISILIHPEKLESRMEKGVKDGDKVLSGGSSVVGMFHSETLKMKMDDIIDFILNCSIIRTSEGCDRVLLIAALQPGVSFEDAQSLCAVVGVKQITEIKMCL